MPKGSSDHHSVYAPRHQRGSRLAPLLLLALAGCATKLDLDPTTTGSIAPAPAEAAAATPAPAPSEKTDDWEAVRRRIVAAQPTPKPPAAVAVAAGKRGQKPADAGAEKGLAWENADSGNSGTITELIASSSAGRACRNFATTLASVDGVRAYRGELCRSGATWEYTKLEPVDRAAETRPKS